MFKLPSVSHHSKQHNILHHQGTNMGSLCPHHLSHPQIQAEMIKVRSISACVCVLSHVWLCDPMDCSPPGSSVHGIFQQEYWRGCHFLLQGIFLIKPESPALVGGFFTTEPPGKSQSIFTSLLKKKKKRFFKFKPVLKSNIFICTQKYTGALDTDFPFSRKSNVSFLAEQHKPIFQPGSCTDHRWVLTEPGGLIQTEQDLLSVCWEKAPPHCLLALVETCQQGTRRFHHGTCSLADCLAPLISATLNDHILGQNRCREWNSTTKKPQRFWRQSPENGLFKDILQVLPLTYRTLINKQTPWRPRTFHFPHSPQIKCFH